MKKLILLFSIAALSFSSSYSQGTAKICDNKYAQWGLEGKPISDAIEFMGNVHNQYQDFLLQSMIDNKISPLSQNFQSFLQNTSISFFAGKGIDATHLPSKGNLDLQNPQFTYSTGNHSNSLEASGILKNLRNVYTPGYESSIPDAIAKLETLKIAALKLSDEKEVIIVGGAISVAIHSLDYWTNNLQKWNDFLGKSNTTDVHSLQYTNTNKLLNRGNVPKRMQTDFYGACLGSIGVADVSGAISGAYAGVAFGPGGALAGGILTSAVSSSGAVIGCALSKLFSWW